MSTTQHFEIPSDILDATRMSIAEVRIELAVHLYQEGRLSFGKARQLAELTHWQFRQLLGSRCISAHYDREELEQDLKTLGATPSR